VACSVEFEHIGDDVGAIHNKVPKCQSGTVISGVATSNSHSYSGRVASVEAGTDRKQASSTVGSEFVQPVSLKIGSVDKATSWSIV